jgi:ABC-type multidrug transport system ATPase subunit
MRQKVVEIAIAFAKDAKISLLDEPTSGLEPNVTAEIIRELGEEGRQF